MAVLGFLPYAARQKPAKSPTPCHFDECLHVCASVCLCVCCFALAHSCFFFSSTLSAHRTACSLKYASNGGRVFALPIIGQYPRNRAAALKDTITGVAATPPFWLCALLLRPTCSPLHPRYQWLECQRGDEKAKKTL